MVKIKAVGSSSSSSSSSRSNKRKRSKNNWYGSIVTACHPQRQQQQQQQCVNRNDKNEFMFQQQTQQQSRQQQKQLQQQHRHYFRLRRRRGCMYYGCSIHLLLIASSILLLVLLPSLSRVNVAARPASSTNFYTTLGVDKTASDKDIKKAYRKMALKYHPDKVAASSSSSSSKEKAEEKFKEIGKAYDVLSDGEKRKLYDQYGEQAVNSPQGGFGMGSTGGGPGFPSGAQFFPFGGGGTSPSGHSGGMDAETLFRQFGGGSGGTGLGGAGGVEGIDLNDILNQFMGTGGTTLRRPGTSSSSEGGRTGGWGARDRQRQQQQQRYEQQQDKTYERYFSCTLGELMTGCTKKLKVSYPTTINTTAKTKTKKMTKTKNYTIDVRPGWKAGTKIKFNRSRNQAAQVFPSIIFVLKETEHQYLVRDTNDLIMKEIIYLTPKQCKKGGIKITVPLPDGEIYSFETKPKEIRLKRKKGEINGVGGKSYTKIIKGRGMPIKPKNKNKKNNSNRSTNGTVFSRKRNDDPGKSNRGDLIIIFGEAKEEEEEEEEDDAKQEQEDDVNI